MPTPNDVAAALANWSGPRSGARFNEASTAARLGQAYTPGQAAGTALQMSAGSQLRNQIAGNYSGVSQSLADQIATANERYKQNKADVSNIFGTLSTIRSADANKIKQQFMDAITASQNAAAARTKQAQAQLALGQQGAATAGAELGGGPTQMPTDSLTSQAVAQGIADASAQQGVWDKLMNLTSAQAQADATNAASGIDLQKAAALQQMQRDYQDQLQGLQGQQLSLQDQIAQAMTGVQANQAEMQQENYLQTLKNQGLTDVANIRARASLAKGSGGASGTGATKYSKDIYGFQQRVNDALHDGNAFNNVMASVDSAIQLATKRKGGGSSATGARGYTVGTAAAKPPTNAEILSAWKALGGGGQYLSFVQDYLKNYR